MNALTVFVSFFASQEALFRIIKDQISFRTGNKPPAHSETIYRRHTVNPFSYLLSPSYTYLFGIIKAASVFYNFFIFSAKKPSYRQYYTIQYTITEELKWTDL